MSTVLYHDHDTSDLRRSKNACDGCRSRKVKCSKELPRCVNCQSCRQACTYPRKVLKPGPKLGSVHKRRILEHEGGERYQSAPRKPWKDALREERDSVDVSGREFGASDEDTLRCSKHMQTVSELCLPSNEVTSPESVATGTNLMASSPRPGHVLISTCRFLGLTVDTMKQLVEIYFRTFTPFGLFREPEFFTKLAGIHSELQMTALLAAMFAFSAKSTQDRDRKSAAHFSNLAITCVDGAFVQCADEVPSLCLLQALILVTHWLILKGVRGRAWRYLGLCIRVAFELDLPSTDDGKDRKTYTEDIEAWCDDEERRRAYWAIREMDQHVNHLKHVPFLTDWTQNQVFLPAEDEKWFRGEPHLSCVASSELLARAKTLQATGHKSARAWYIMLCSLVAEAWDLTYSTTKINQFRKWKSIVSNHESSNHRSSLLNALRLYVKMLPPELKFHGQLLDFGTRTSGRSRHPSIIHDHSWICLIALMTEAVKLTSHKPFVFEAYLQKTVKMAREGIPGHAKGGETPLSDENLSPKVELCYAASDAILNIFLACHESHYQYIHPYIAQSAWSSATVQLLRREMTENEFEKQVIRSKYEILKAISGRFVHYWEMSEVPKQNLDELDLRLKQFTTASQNVTHRAKSPSVSFQSQTTITPHETSLEWNDSLMFDTSLGRPGSLDLPSSRPSHSPSTTPAICLEASTQPSSTATRNGLESSCPPIFFPGQDHDLEDSNCASFQESESTVTPWPVGDLSQPQISNGLSEPLDWLSFFTNADLNGELSDCYEAFSGPFLS